MCVKIASIPSEDDKSKKWLSMSFGEFRTLSENISALVRVNCFRLPDWPSVLKWQGAFCCVVVYLAKTGIVT